MCFTHMCFTLCFTHTPVYKNIYTYCLRQGLLAGARDYINHKKIYKKIKQAGVYLNLTSWRVL